MYYADNIPSKEEILKNYPVDLSRYVPDFIYNNTILNKIYKSQEYQLGFFYWQIDDLIDQCFIETATWGLTIREEEYGIETDLSLTYEQRRKILKARKNAIPVTKKFIENLAESFVDSAEVIENTSPYYFDLTLYHEGQITDFWEKLNYWLGVYKPAHLEYNLKLKANKNLKNTVYLGCALNSNKIYNLSCNFDTNYTVKNEIKDATTIVKNQIYNL